MWLIPYGVPFLVVLGCPELCLEVLFDMLNCWRSFGRPRSVAVWKMVPTCLFWCVWKERNDRCFEDKERMLGTILSLFYDTLYLWTVAYVSFVD
jgi:hypothetical protein